MRINKVKLVVSLALPFVAGAVGSYFTYPAIGGWYEGLDKPSFSPPNFLFGPVWICLYLLMGISFYMVWNAKKTELRERAIQVYLFQLVLNSFWSIAFFGMKNPAFAFVIILFMLTAIFMTIRAFERVKKTASVLLYPYIAWVAFAALLNLSIALLN